MKARGFALVLAILLGLAAMASVYLYVQGVRDKAEKAPDMVTVIVPKADIAAGTNLDDLISNDGFTTAELPADAVVQGAVTQLTQLEHTTTSYPILAGEQISTLRLQGFSEQPPGGVLGIPAGYRAVTLPFELAQSVGGVVQRGDHLTLFATFDDVTLVTPGIAALLGADNPPESVEHQVGDFTVTLVPDAEVLKVETKDESQTQTNQDTPVLLTLALTDADAQNVVFSQEQGRVWLALLPPNEQGTAVPPSNVIDIVLERAK
jgi:pilus assembly protein CpaB